MEMRQNEGLARDALQRRQHALSVMPARRRLMIRRILRAARLNRLSLLAPARLGRLRSATCAAARGSGRARHALEHRTVGQVEMQRRDRDRVARDHREVAVRILADRLGEIADPEHVAGRRDPCSSRSAPLDCAGPAAPTAMPVTCSGGIGGKLTFISRSSGQASATSLRMISGAEFSAVFQCSVSPIADLAQGDRRDAEHGGFHRRGDGAGIGHVLAEIGAAVDAGQHEVRRAGPRLMCLTAISTQSVGVPSTAKRLRPELVHPQRPPQRQRSGWRRSARLSGATTQTSSDSERAICSST